MSLGNLPRLGAAIFVALGALAVGCGHVDSEEALPPARLDPALDVSTQSKAKEVAQEFVAAVQKGGSTAASSLAPSSRIKAADLNGPAFRPFVGGGGLEFDSVDSASGGKKVVARVHFLGTDGKIYRTNLTMVREGERLRVEDVLRPTYATKPTASGQSAGKL